MQMECVESPTARCAFQQEGNVTWGSKSHFYDFFNQKKSKSFCVLFLELLFIVLSVTNVPQPSKRQAILSHYEQNCCCTYIQSIITVLPKVPFVFMSCFYLQLPSLSSTSPQFIFRIMGGWTYSIQSPTPSTKCHNVQTCDNHDDKTSTIQFYSYSKSPFSFTSHKKNKLTLLFVLCLFLFCCIF